jgi:putative PIN family toxin of toxin-antitoxin system
MEKIVLDTNVLIDGARDELSAGWRIIQDVLEGRLTASVSEPLRAEYSRILERTIRDPSYHDRLREFLRVAHVVPLPRIPPVVAEDPEDDKVLATAVAAHADAVISSDRHLLSLDPYEGIRIVTPHAFSNLHAEGDGAWSEFAAALGIRPRT